MSDIKPIETYYKGYRFRSRLEARWAVFFDAAGIEYQYEPEGFKVSYSEDGINEEYIFYLPDFYLPKEECYAEVKGTDEALRADGKKIAFAVDFGATPCSEGLLILGGIPDPTRIGWGNIPLFSFLYNDKAIVHKYAAFIPIFGRVHLVNGSDRIIQSLYNYDDLDFSDAYGDMDIPVSASTKCKWSKDELRSHDFGQAPYWNGLAKAFMKARQARFEHGETPT